MLVRPRRRLLPRLQPRLVLCFVPLLLLYIALLVRAASLQLLPHSKLTQFMQRTEPTSMVFTQPERGMILDRQGRELAINLNNDSTYIDPTLFTKERNWRRNLGKVALITGEPYHVLLNKLGHASRFFWVKRHLKNGEAEKLRQLKINGLNFIVESSRHYPNGSLAAHLLGFTNIDGSGVEGLEYSLDSLLKGSVGKLIGQRDAKGRRLIVGGIESTGSPGANVTITIDSVLQYMVERELARATSETQSQGAMGLIMHPVSGEILALAVYPTFDPNHYQEYPKERWRNRLVADIYEPGSTFKSLVVAYGLERGVLHPTDRFYCKPASLVVGRKVINETHKDLTWLSPGEVLKYSSNIGAARIALQIGATNMGGLLNDFGFGAKTALGLPGEAVGLILPKERWTDVDLAAAGYGQGIGVTPLQMLRAYAALVNGGELLRPYLSLQAQTNPSGEILKLGNRRVEKHPISSSTSKELRRMLRGVVEEHGTGALAAIPDYRVGGKTGTAQRFDPIKASYLDSTYISSFIGYLPIEDPQLLMMVIIEAPQGTLNSGGMVAAPVFRRIAAQAAQVMHISPDLGPDLGPDFGPNSRPDFESPVTRFAESERPRSAPSAASDRQKLTYYNDTSALKTLDVKNFDEAGNLEFKGGFKGLTARQAIHFGRTRGFEVVVRGSGFATGKVTQDERQPKKLYVEFARQFKRKY